MYHYLYPWHYEPDQLKGLPFEKRIKIALLQVVIYLAAFAIGLALCSLLGSCTTPRAVEEHHHHHYEADTLAVKAHVDRQLTSWHEEMTRFFQQRLEEYSASWFSHEDQQETITELITVTTDSVGRTIRQEQRTISRDITRELQQQEQRLTREYEERLRVAVDSIGSIYQSRYDSLASHVAQLDSTLAKKTPVGDTRPWYQKLWAKALLILFGAALLFFAVRRLHQTSWNRQN